MGFNVGSSSTAIELNPQDLYSYNNLGIVYRALKRDDDAIEYFRKQIAIQIPGATADSAARVIALVDGHGKVLEARPGDPQAPESLVTEAKSLTLRPITSGNVPFGRSGRWSLGRMRTPNGRWPGHT